MSIEKWFIPQSNNYFQESKQCKNVYRKWDYLKLHHQQQMSLLFGGDCFRHLSMDYTDTYIPIEGLYRNIEISRKRNK